MPLSADRPAGEVGCPIDKFDGRPIERALTGTDFA
jgi:hypothetical protein